MKQERGAGTVARGMYHLFLGNTISTFLMAITAILVSRLLGPDGYGLYTIAIIPVSYLLVIGSLGTSTAATRFAAKYQGEGKEEKAASFVFSMTAFQGIVAIILAMATVPLSLAIANFLNRPELTPLVPMVALAFVGQAVFNVATSGYQGLGRMDRSALLQVLMATLKLVVSLSLILVGFAATGALIGYTLSYVVAGFAGAVAVVALSRRRVLSQVYADVGVALRYSFPIYLSGLMGGFISPIQVTLLAYFTTNRNIGGYGAASNITTLVALVVYPISTALFPLFSRLSDDRRALEATFQMTVKYATLFVAPVTMLLMVLCVPVSQAVYGRAYTFSATYLLLIVSPNLLVGLGNLSQGPLLLGMGKTKKVLLAGIVGAVITLVSSFALVVPLGIIGIIAATVMGSVAGVAAAWVMVSGELGANVKVSEVVRIYGASAIAAVAVFPLSYLPLHPILVTVLGGAAYFLLFIPILAVTKALTSEDLVSLTTYFGGTGPFALLLRLTIKYYIVFAGS